MPTYCYRVIGSDELVELVMSCAEMERRQTAEHTIVLDDGSIAKRDFATEHGGFKNTAGNWPMVSYAAGVHPSQVKEAQEHVAKQGIHTDYTPQGDAIFRSRSHRRDHLRAIGLRDRNAGYGDS